MFVKVLPDGELAKVLGVTVPTRCISTVCPAPCARPPGLDVNAAFFFAGHSKKHRVQVSDVPVSIFSLEAS